MLSAIEFDYETSLDRTKIREILSNRILSAKLGSAHLTSPQMAPQDSLGLGLFAPQAPRVMLRHFVPAHCG
jgi:hypothetical protein